MIKLLTLGVLAFFSTQLCVSSPVSADTDTSSESGKIERKVGNLEPKVANVSGKVLPRSSFTGPLRLDERAINTIFVYDTTGYSGYVFDARGIRSQPVENIFVFLKRYGCFVAEKFSDPPNAMEWKPYAPSVGSEEAAREVVEEFEAKKKFVSKIIETARKSKTFENILFFDKNDLVRAQGERKNIDHSIFLTVDEHCTQYLEQDLSTYSYSISIFSKGSDLYWGKVNLPSLVIPKGENNVAKRVAFAAYAIEKVFLARFKYQEG